MTRCVTTCLPFFGPDGKVFNACMNYSGPGSWHDSLVVVQLLVVVLIVDQGFIRQICWANVAGTAR